MDLLVELKSLEQQLSQLVVEIRERESKQNWQAVESISRDLANGLRTRDGSVDNHSILGRTALPQSIASLLTFALHGHTTPPEEFAPMVIEILRVAANVCMDHDENRGYLLNAGLPQSLVSLLEGYAGAIHAPLPTEPLSLSVLHLKVIRTAIGVLLNTSIGFDPVKSHLNSLEATMTILKLSIAVYPPGFWVNPSASDNKLVEAATEEEWVIRSGLSSWAWRTVSELRDVKDETQIFTPDILPLLTAPLLAFLPPYPPNSTALFGSNLTSTINILLQADFEILQESCMLIESLSLDIEDIRLSLARGLYFPAEHSGTPCLSIILDFIEHGTYPPLWESPVFSKAEIQRKEKAFNICKAALIKSVVEVVGEESNKDVLWDDSEMENPGGEFVCRMVSWIKRYVADMETTLLPDTKPGSILDRDDLVICASLALGNLARREKNSSALLSPPHSLAPVLTSKHLLSPSVDIKVKHGVLGLLKHLSQASAQSSLIRNSLTNANVVLHISQSGIWDDKVDVMAEIVQLSAIGVVKHMCNANVENACALVLPSGQSPSPTGLTQILDLINRSNSVPIKSEGTRILVNVVKSLWSSDPPPSPIDPSRNSPPAGYKDQKALLERQRKRDAAIQVVLSPAYVLALAGLVGRSGKYPLLVNEGVVALSLLSTQREGGPLVLNAITTPLVSDLPSGAGSIPGSTLIDTDSPAVSAPQDESRTPVPRHALDMLIFALKNVDNPANFPVEIRVNICSFLVQLERHNSGEELKKVKNMVQPVLEYLEDIVPGEAKEEILRRAINRLIDAWK